MSHSSGSRERTGSRETPGSREQRSRALAARFAKCFAAREILRHGKMGVVPPQTARLGLPLTSRAGHAGATSWVESEAVRGPLDQEGSNKRAWEKGALAGGENTSARDSESREEPTAPRPAPLSSTRAR